MEVIIGLRSLLFLLCSPRLFCIASSTEETQRTRERAKAKRHQMKGASISACLRFLSLATVHCLFLLFLAAPLRTLASPRLLSRFLLPSSPWCLVFLRELSRMGSSCSLISSVSFSLCLPHFFSSLAALLLVSFALSISLSVVSPRVFLPSSSCHRKFGNLQPQTRAKVVAIANTTAPRKKQNRTES